MLNEACRLGVFAGTTVNPAAANMSSSFCTGEHADMTTRTARSIRNDRAHGMVIFFLDQVPMDLTSADDAALTEQAEVGGQPMLRLEARKTSSISPTGRTHYAISASGNATNGSTWSGWFVAGTRAGSFACLAQCGAPKSPGMVKPNRPREPALSLRRPTYLRMTGQLNQPPAVLY
jgi:hypothetical protein